MLTQEQLRGILERLKDLDLGMWLFIVALVLSWLVPVVKGLWEKERKRREKRKPQMSGPIVPR